MLRVFSHYVSARLLLLVALDAVTLAVCVEWAVSLYAADLAADAAAAPHAAGYTRIAFVAMMVFVMNGMGLYEPSVAQHLRSVVIRLVVAALAGAVMTLTLLAAAMPAFVPLEAVLAATAGALVCCGAMRWIYSRWDTLRSFRPRVLVVGSSSGAAKLAELAQRHRNHEVVGYLACGPGSPTPFPLPRLLPAAGESICAVADKYGIDHIVIAVKDRRGGALPVDALLECRLKGIRVNELSSFFEREHRQILLESLTPSWMVFGEGFRQGLLRTMVKRLFDVVVSTALIVLTLPVMLITAVCIALESGRPVLYRQERVGEGGCVFNIYKFRSMNTGAEGDGKPRWAGANDDRTTRVGRFIRKARIDELPQVLNVLKGEMSFVGPRPERPYFVDKLTAEIPFYGLRHSIKPGITGWAQVRYPYGASIEDAVEKLQYDLYYVKNHSLFLDLVILAATVEVVLWGDGSGARQPPAVSPANPTRIGPPSAEVK